MRKNQTKEEEADFVEVSMRLTSGRFESTIKLPLKAEYKEIEAALGNWWETLELVVKCGKSLDETTSTKEV